MRVAIWRAWAEPYSSCCCNCIWRVEMAARVTSARLTSRHIPAVSSASCWPQAAVLERVLHVSRLPFWDARQYKPDPPPGRLLYVSRPVPFASSAWRERVEYGPCNYPGTSSVNDILLISISGEDQPGLTAGITAILARHSVNVLDIGQAVIHATLSMGVLVEVPDNCNSQGMVEAVESYAQGRGMQVRITPVSAGSYAHWVQARAAPAISSHYWRAR